MQDKSTDTFYSILFVRDSPQKGERLDGQDFFHDLNLDHIVAAITKGRQEYELTPFFCSGGVDLETITYRQEVMRDLEVPALFEDITRFAGQMREVREGLSIAENHYYKRAGDRWFLDAVDGYSVAVYALLRALDRIGPKSRGLRAFRDYLAEYTQSAAFKELGRQVEALILALSAIRYSLVVRGGSVTVRDYEPAEDYGKVIEDTFAKFKQSAAKNYLANLGVPAGMNHVEAEILERVAKLNPDTFRALDAFRAKNGDFLDERIARFDREIQFYVAFLEYARGFRRHGLEFCYPQMSDTSRNVTSRGAFDLALASRLIAEKTDVVCNDILLTGEERILVVTGPNQGGKTTFARVFGQLHYLASLGCPVPGTEARLFLPDRIFTHFEREERLTTLRGKLQDDLVRIHRILSEASSKSVIIINEIFSSTTIGDGILLGRKIMEQLSRLDALCVCVTFLDELAALNEKIVSVVAMVAPDDPDRRTYRIARRPADGRAYALAVARKYRLTYELLKERVRS